MSDLSRRGAIGVGALAAMWLAMARDALPQDIPSGASADAFNEASDRRALSIFLNEISTESGQRTYGSDLSAGNPDDVMRALQTMGIERIIGTVRTTRIRNNWVLLTVDPDQEELIATLWTDLNIPGTLGLPETPSLPSALALL